jgi:glycosyltransferase involved in cell wall biosynthesis
LTALPEVLKQVPDVFLVIVGPGDDRPRLEAMAQELKVTDRVRFAGRVSDEELQSYLAACDLFVLPSTGEGFGIVYLEAMFHGKACIGARAGGVPEVIEHEVTGLLVDPERLDRLAEVISRLLTGDANRFAMGAAGKLRLEREFSTQRFRDRLAALIGVGN